MITLLIDADACPDEADNWIAERVHRGDIVVTADVPLASRCVKAGAAVLAPNGSDLTYIPHWGTLRSNAFAPGLGH